jgi:hypothetical protein
MPVGVQLEAVTPAYELWVTSWEAALAAVLIASQTGTLSADDAVAHRTVVITERELVTKQFTLLVGQLAEP